MSSPSTTSVRHPRFGGSRGVATVVSLFLLILAGAVAGTALTSTSPAAAVTNSGVFGWGDNTSGQATGSATSTSVTRPSKVSGLSTLKQVVALEGLSFGLRTDGVVVSWGAFSDVRLKRTTAAPAPVPGWTGVTSITHSHGKVLAQRSSGNTLCAGPACTATDFSVPNFRSGMGQVREMAFSMPSVLFMRTGDGSVWGNGPRSLVAPGQSGDQYETTMAKIAGFSGITSISAGYNMLTALDSSGRVRAWGDTPGDGTAENFKSGVLVPGLSDVVQVDMADISGGFRYALTRSGSVYEWGGVGKPSASNRVVLTPQRMTSLPTVKKIIVKRSMAYALTTAGEVWQWDPDSSSSVPTPVKVSGVSGATDFTAFGADGWSFELTAYALRGDGTVVSWGSGESGQLGDGSSSDRTSAAVVPGLTGLKGLDGDGSTVVAIGTFDPSATSPTTAPTSSPSPTNPWAANPCYQGIKSVDGQWRFAWRVTEDDGVALTGASLNGRKAIRAMQAPWMIVTVTTDGSSKDYPVELRPVRGPVGAGPTSSLTSLTCDRRSVVGSYAITDLPHGLKVFVEQGYVFADQVPNDKCEPSGTVPCARMWPSLHWVTNSNPMPDRVKVEVTTIQRFDLQPDGGLAGEGMVMRDKINASSNVGVVAYPKGWELNVQAIPTTPIDQWDNYHQSANVVTMPGNPWGDGIDPVLIKPGCADCVHMHWRWTSLLKAQAFTSGEPAVHSGSPQRAWISVVREHLDRDETDTDDPTRLVDGEAMAGGHPIVYWKTTSTGISAGGGDFYDEAIPDLRTSLFPGDRGGFWFSPVKPATSTSSMTSSTSMGHH